MGKPSFTLLFLSTPCLTMT